MAAAKIKSVKVNCSFSNEEYLQKTLALLADIFQREIFTDPTSSAQKIIIGNSEIQCETMKNHPMAMGLRNLAGRSHFARITSVSLFHEERLISQANGSGYHETFATPIEIATHDIPVSLCSLQLQSLLKSGTVNVENDSYTLDTTNDDVGVKEVAIGTGAEGERTELALSVLAGTASTAVPRCWNVWSLGAHLPFIRLLPSTTSSLVFKVHSIEMACKTLEEKGVHYNRIGRTNIASGQIILQSPFLCGLDFRLCENKETLPVFHESTETLLSTSVAELHSSRVLGSEEGQPNKPLNSTEANKDDFLGDCWMEFRAMIKRPSGFFKVKK